MILYSKGRQNFFSSSEEKLRYCGHENSELTQGYRSFLEPSVLEVKKIHQADWLGLDYGSGPYPALAQILLEHKINVDIYDPFFAPKIKRNSYDFFLSVQKVGGALLPPGSRLGEDVFINEVFRALGCDDRKA